MIPARSSSVLALTTASFDEVVLAAARPVLVELGADWCPPCHLMTPILEDLAVEEAGHLDVGMVDVEASPDLADRYAVQHLPTLLLFDRGQVVARIVGAVPRARLRLAIATALEGAP